MKQPSSPQRDYCMLPSKTCQAHHSTAKQNIQMGSTWRLWQGTAIAWHRTFHYDLKALCIAWDEGEELNGNCNRWRDLVAQYNR